MLTVLGTFVAYFIVHSNPSNLTLFLPEEFKSSFDGWKEGFSDHGTISAGEGAVFSASLMTHNTEVGLMAAATGLTTVLPIYFMLQNGFIMGALIAVVQPTGHLTSMWAGILPHGVCELSAIFIAAGAGLLIGWAIIHPGQLSRRDALLVNTKDAAKIPHFVKFTLAAIQFIALMLYIYGDWTKTRFNQTSMLRS
jgi:uncharacterized membrane protein SpoIIM required for sporulation